MTTPSMDFETMVRRGLGRAVLYAQQNDMLPYRDVTLHACLHNLAHDPQSEPNRAQYMYDLVQMIGDKAYYSEKLRTALNNPSEEYSLYQIYELLGLLAKDGDGEARTALHQAVARDAAAHGYEAVEPFLELEGMSGFVYFLQQISKYPVLDDDHWLLSFYVDQFFKPFGEDRAQAGLDRITAENPELSDVVAFIRSLQEERKTPSARKRRPDPDATYDEITRRIQTLDKNTSRWFYRKVGAKLDETTVLRFAQDLLNEDDPERLRRYLHLFESCIFPLPVGRLLALAIDEDYQIAYAARSALANIISEDVRTLAIDLLENSEEPFEAIEMLIKNYRTGDWNIIANAAKRTLSEDTYDQMVNGTRELFEAHPDQEAKDALLTLYEQGPCIMCRHTLIEDLQELEDLPRWMIDECRYDAYSETRELAWSLLRE